MVYVYDKDIVSQIFCLGTEVRGKEETDMAISHELVSQFANDNVQRAFIDTCEGCMCYNWNNWIIWDETLQDLSC